MLLAFLFDNPYSQKNDGKISDEKESRQVKEKQHPNAVANAVSVFLLFSYTR